jgi:penicillin-binding protein 1A
MDKVGPEAVVKLTHKLGVKSEIPTQASIALGAVDITVERYGCSIWYICQSRCLYQATVLTRIEDKSGVIIYEPIPESHDVLNKDIAFAIIKLLEGVTEGGSGKIKN